MSKSNQWELFGVDLRQLGWLFKRAWQEVFWAYSSPVREALDKSVTTYRWDKGKAPELTAAKGAGLAAIVLPDDFVLARSLMLPRAALANLPGVISAEVDASSPFLAEDRMVGARLNDTGNRSVELVLAIVSRSSVMTLLHQTHADIKQDDFEIWAEHKGQPVVLEGFGEHHRNKLYKKRLFSLGGFFILGLFSLSLLLALPAIYQNHRYAEVQQALEASEDAAAVAMRYRNKLLENNNTLEALQREKTETISPLIPLAILSDQLGDDAWLGGYEQERGKIEVSGYANNAAELIQQLTEGGDFKGVKPVSAIRQVRRSNVERFELELQLATNNAGEL
ncbi:PilN domain-containing protein [Gilvimarinus sp. 1_MG-2023]|uniref:PilN domain-containing protein n=1 Tax=Gilvimarinus sp. 1_MG-2023 TaxID=3062638 RepID=UPI0026E2A06B|nr:PilN domain-containing protein [Gilvimarinus sp. 1_MG-2023]MDO6746790.1 PilN domain-containing protein [Gilvimarinus sp. 1_MG-2023]